MADVVLDTNVIVAMLDENDALHARAVALLDRLRRIDSRTVLLDIMIAEALSTLCRRATQRKSSPPDLARVQDQVRSWLHAKGLPFSQVRFPIAGPAEFIVYRDAESFDSWQKFGATHENQDTMIHVIVTPEDATLVVDRADSPLASLAREILSSVSWNRNSLTVAYEP